MRRKMHEFIIQRELGSGGCPKCFRNQKLDGEEGVHRGLENGLSPHNGRVGKKARDANQRNLSFLTRLREKKRGYL